MNPHVKLLVTVLLICTIDLDSALGVNDIQRLSKRSTLAESPDCKEDVKALCANEGSDDDLVVLNCLQNSEVDGKMVVSQTCHNLLWSFKLNITKDNRFLDTASRVCREEIERIEECQTAKDTPNHLLPCLLENVDKINLAQCKEFVVKVGTIIFTDYRLIDQFAQTCESDIRKLGCGRVDAKSDASRPQGQTIACLSEHVSELQPDCYRETLRAAELQSTDYHLDRPLFLACRADRETFCRQVVAGDGRVYKCLMQQIASPVMSTQCRDQLARRQKLVSLDYKVSHGLAKACKADIKTYSCKGFQSKDKNVQLARVLLCLESALHRGDAVDPVCQSEMLRHRQALLQNYKLSPELVTSCATDIETFCKNKLVGGRTIHCLMKQAKRSRKVDKGLSDVCRRAVEDLVRLTDAGSDWETDSVLKEACQPVVEAHCKESIGHEGRVLSCLMDHLNSKSMNAACEEALLEIQYFVARDFRLDPQLYQRCRNDAVKLCHAQAEWASNGESMDVDRAPLVLPCLYRYAYTDESTQQLEPGCLQEIKRVMKQRAVNVDLQPEIEEPCMNDLARFCSDKTGKGEEILCLQDSLEKLSPDCKTAVTNFTEVEAGHIELNPLVSMYCDRFLEDHCLDDQEDVMDCLIQFKVNPSPDVKMNSKCKAAIEHFQFITMKNVRFSPRFKHACRMDITRYCNSGKTKLEVVTCLSELMLNDTFQQSRTLAQPKVSSECKKQLRLQLIEQHENSGLNPAISTACSDERIKFCKNVEPGQGRVLECLKENRQNLGKSCHKVVFKVEQEEMVDNAVDFALMNTCQDDIQHYCAKVDPSRVLECLKARRNSYLNSACKELVVRRMIEQSLDIRFNPVLRDACRLEIGKFCREIFATASPGQELEGAVISCLKEKFVDKQSLGMNCAAELAKVMEEAGLDYRQDPVLVKRCKKDIAFFCQEVADKHGQGLVTECLKSHLEDPRMAYDCKRLVAQSVQAAQVDVQVDPILHNACAIDLQLHCDHVPNAEGKRLTCLLRLLREKPLSLQKECATLLESRVNLFGYASKIVLPETVEQAFRQLNDSPSRHYFLAVALVATGLIFIMGLFCGRVSKRHHAMKTK